MADYNTTNMEVAGKKYELLNRMVHTQIHPTLAAHKILSSFSSVVKLNYGLKRLWCHHFIIYRSVLHGSSWGDETVKDEKGKVRELYPPHRSTSWWRVGHCPLSTCPSPPHTDPRMIWMARSEWSWCPCRKNNTHFIWCHKCAVNQMHFHRHNIVTKSANHLLL